MSLAELKARFSQAGRLSWIGLRPGQGEPMRVVEEVEVFTGRGLFGDRKAQRSGGERQVSLFQLEHVAVIASLLGQSSLPPELLRRNLGISGINLLALRDGKFRIGGVEFEATGACAPCRRLEETLGPGGFNAMRGHGGITARVLTGGRLRLGDPVTALSDTSTRLGGP